MSLCATDEYSSMNEVSQKPIIISQADDDFLGAQAARTRKNDKKAHYSS